jgi:ribosomal protein S9
MLIIITLKNINRTPKYGNGTNITNSQMSVNDEPLHIYQQPEALRIYQQHALDVLGNNQKFRNDINNNNGIP